MARKKNIGKKQAQRLRQKKNKHTSQGGAKKPGRKANRLHSAAKPSAVLRDGVIDPLLGSMLPMVAQKQNTKGFFAYLDANQIPINGHFQMSKAHLIHTVAENGTADMMRELLKRGVDFHKLDSKKWNALHFAAQKGDFKMSRYLLDASVDINATTQTKATALSIAAMHGHASVVELLLSRGADKEMADKNGVNALVVAADQGHAPVVASLLKYKANTRHTTPEDITALDLAQRNGHDKIVELLNRDRKPNTSSSKTRFGSTPEQSEQMLLQGISNNDLDTVRAILKAGAAVNQIALHRAVAHSSKEMVALLLQSKADVKSIDRWHNTALHQVAYNVKEGAAIAKLLLEAGLDVDVRNRTYETVLHATARENQMALARMLIEHGADIDATDDDKNTPLSFAVGSGNEAMVEFLLASKADLNHHNSRQLSPVDIAKKKNDHAMVALLLGQSSIGLHLNDKKKKPKKSMIMCLLQFQQAISLPDNTKLKAWLVQYASRINDPLPEEDANHPLHIAAEYGNVAAVSLLLEHKANLYQTAIVQKWNALHFATQHNHIDIARYLIQSGLQVNALAEGDISPLAIASMRGYSEFVHLLLSHKADVNQPDFAGVTPLIIAAEKRHLAVVHVLLNHKVNVHLKNKKGHNALQLAQTFKAVKIAALLKKTMAVSPPLDSSALDSVSDFYAKTTELYEKLLKAINVADVTEIKAILDLGVDISADCGEEILAAAIKSGNETVVDCLLQAGCGPSALGRLIQPAIEMGNANVLASLLSYEPLFPGGPYNDQYYDSAFGDPAILKVLSESEKKYYSLPRFGSLEKKDSNGWHAGHFVVKNDSSRLVRHFLKDFSYLDGLYAVTHEGDTLLHIAARRADGEFIMRLMFSTMNFYYSHELGLDAQNNQGQTPLLLATLHGNGALVHVLLLHGADVHIQDVDGNTPLHHAVRHGHIQIIETLLHAGALAHTCNAQQQDAFALAKGDVLACLHEHSRAEIAVKDASNGAVKSDNEPQAVVADKQVLTNAIEQNDHVALRAWLAAANESDCQNLLGHAFLQAAKMGWYGILDILIAHGVNVDVQDEKGRSALYLMTKEKNIEAIEALIALGASINIRTHQNATPLYMAVQNKDRSAMRVLLAAGAAINMPIFNGTTPLHRAIASNKLGLVNDLLAHWPNLDFLDDKGISPKALAASKGNRAVVAKLQKASSNRVLLRRKKSEQKTIDYLDNGQVRLGVMVNRMQQVEKALVQGASANDFYAGAFSVGSIFSSALDHNNLDMIRLLLQYGADVHKKQGSDTLMELAVSKDHLPFVRLLLAWQASLRGAFPKVRSLAIAQLLVAYDADINEVGYKNRTALFSACDQKGDVIRVRWLLSQGANTDIQDDDGKTALFAAIENKYEHSVRLLLAYKADVHIQDNKGNTPLLLAAGSCQVNLVQQLLEKGALLVSNHAGFSPLQNACAHFSLPIIQLLLAKRKTKQVIVAPTKPSLEEKLIAAVKRVDAKEVEGLFSSSEVKEPLLSKAFNVALEEDHVQMVILLVAKGIEIDQPAFEAQRPLEIAIARGSVQMVTCVLDLGAVCREEDLQLAMKLDQVDVLSVLLTKESKVDPQWPMLYHAISLKNEGIVDWLVGKGQSINAHLKSMPTPLGASVERNWPAGVACLLGHKAHINGVDDKKQTPLHHAVALGHADMVAYLLAEGADRLLENFSGQSPLFLARMGNNDAIKQIMAGPRLLRIWCGKHGIPNYQPVAKKELGSSIGFIAQKKRPKGALKETRYMVKLGLPDEKNYRATLTTRGQLKYRTEITAVEELVAAHLYTLLGRDHFYVAKHRLAILEMVNAYNKDHMLLQALVGNLNQNRPDNEQVKESIHLVSKWVKDYCDLDKLSQCALVQNSKEFSSFMNFVDQGALPCFAKIEGQCVPIVGLAELLAVARVLADTDVLGGGGKNAGFVIERDQRDHPIAVRIVKIDAGESFNFGGDNNYLTQSFNRVSRKKKLKDKRDLQFGNMNPRVIKWDGLQKSMQHGFLVMLKKIKSFMGRDGLLSALVVRKDHFNHSPLGVRKLVTPEASQELIDGLHAYLDIQFEGDVYGQEPALKAQAIAPDQPKQFIIPFDPKKFDAARYTDEDVQALLDVCGKP